MEAIWINPILFTNSKQNKTKKSLSQKSTCFFLRINITLMSSILRLPWSQFQSICDYFQMKTCFIFWHKNLNTSTYKPVWLYKLITFFPPTGMRPGSYEIYHKQQWLSVRGIWVTKSLRVSHMVKWFSCGLAVCPWVRSILSTAAALWQRVN